MNYKEFDFAYHNTTFYGQYWQNTSAKAAILLVHGMGEHSTRYTDFVIPTLLDSSLSVISFDQFGHGKSGGKRGHTPSFEALLDCVAIVSEKANSIFGKVPTFLYGHSMGGNVVINYILRRNNDFTGLIATSPFLSLAFKPPSWKLAMGSILQKILPSVTMPSELEVAGLSRDESEVQKYIDDPLNHDKISPNYSITIMKTGQWAIENAKKLQKPMLLMHGSADGITSYKASETFANKNEKLITFIGFDGAYHELHNDHCKHEMMTTMTNWIQNQLNQRKKTL